MPEKYRKITTEIILAGEHAEAYLTRKELLDKTHRNENGEFLVGKFAGRKRRSILGTTHVEFGFVKETGNREVILFGGWLGNKKKGRKISVSPEGVGFQQFTNGVDIVVRTNAETAVYEENIR